MWVLKIYHYFYIPLSNISNTAIKVSVSNLCKLKNKLICSFVFRNGFSRSSIGLKVLRSVFPILASSESHTISTLYIEQIYFDVFLLIIIDSLSYKLFLFYIYTYIVFKRYFLYIDQKNWINSLKVHHLYHPKALFFFIIFKNAAATKKHFSLGIWASCLITIVNQCIFVVVALWLFY